MGAGGGQQSKRQLLVYLVEVEERWHRPRLDPMLPLFLPRAGFSSAGP